MISKNRQTLILVLAIPVLTICGTFAIWAQNDTPGPQAQDPHIKLAKATMCERVRDYEPSNPAIAFPISLGKVACYTLFDPVPEKVIIYHYWYRRDVLSTTIGLELQPPRWGAFSEIQLREADKGPWRVEVKDENGKLFKVLRFSITE